MKNRRKTILMLVSLLAVSMTMLAQAVSLNLNNVTVMSAIKQFEKASSYSFVYKVGDLDTEKHVSVNAVQVKDAVEQILAGQDVAYEISGRNIVIRKNALSGMSRNQTKRQITGVIVDESGEPITGANVVEKGTTNGTTTDADGKFGLSVADDAVLIISYIGYTSQEVTVSGKTSFSIQLAEDTQNLEEVVVIGYGTARKVDLTGSLSSVKGETLTERSTQMLSTALQGQMAGVQVTRSSGGPGAQGTVRIHGVTTMSTNDPLVIIDGVPGSLNDVIADDVETMSVLKDAASAAIYGSRAAAGVILITTKRAKDNAFSFDYNFQYAIDAPTTRHTNGDVIDWFNIQNEIKWNDGASDPYSVYSQDLINGWLSKNATDPYHYPNTDWVDMMLKKTTNHQQHAFSVTGGKGDLRTKFTFNYQQGDGYYKYRSYERYTGRMNNDWQINKWLKANVDIDFSTSESVSPSNDNVMYFTYVVSPYYNPYWENGKYADVKDGANPIASIEEGGTANTKYYKMGGKAQIDITPFENLTITGIFAPRYTFMEGKTFDKAVDVFYESGSTVKSQFHKNTNLYEKRNDTHSYTYQAYVNYKHVWGEHSFNAMAGYEGYTYKWENLDASRTNYLLDTYPYLNIGPEDYQYNSGNAGHNAYRSYFGRLMYAYKNRYMFQANVRTDGSSRFAKDSRWGTFPSVSAGWVISEEPWFNNKGLLTYLKLRGSIGQLGNERIGSEFPYQAAISFGNSYMYDKSSQSVTAVQNAAQVYYAFKDITWETTTTEGLGIDARFLSDRLRFTGDYYYKKTKDMLLTLGFPSYAGFSAPSQNAGDMHTKGWDIELGWNDQIGDFSYGISANISDYRSIMGYLGDKRTIDGNYIIEKGSYYNEWFMYMSDGLFQTDADLTDATGKTYPTLTKNDKAGNIKYVDVNNDGVINSDDKVRLGNSLPEYTYGGNINLGYKDWDFNLSFQGIGHQNVLFQSSWIQPLKEQWGAVPSLLLGNYWSQHNTAEENADAKYPRLTYTNTTNTYAGSDYWLFNGAYFRVKNLTLGYTVPKRIMEKTFIRNLRIYANITDLPAISHYPKGWDPEVGTSSEYISTSFIFGLNVKF